MEDVWLSDLFNTNLVISDQWEMIMKTICDGNLFMIENNFAQWVFELGRLAQYARAYRTHAIFLQHTCYLAGTQRLRILNQR